MAMTKVKGLQMWCQRRLDGYRDVNIVDMTKSWKSGLAFCALIHRFRPDLIDYDSLSKENIFENNQLAFEVAERELGIPALLEAQDMVDIRVPDKLSVVTYVSQYYNYFKDAPQLGGPGVTAKQTSSSSHKRSPAVQPVTGPEIKRFAPANDRNVESAASKKNEETKKTSTLGDKCVICNNKVYLLERQIENGKLYHRSCFRHSELSPTAKVFKSSLTSPSDDFESKAKVRKTDENPSLVKSNGLKHVEPSQNSKSDPNKSLFSTDARSQTTAATGGGSSSKPDPLLERLKSRMEVDKKESDVPKYKQNRPLILQTATKEPDDGKKAEPPTPTFNAKKFDKHEFGFLSKNKESNTKAEESKPKETKSGFLSSKTDPTKSTETSSKAAFPVPKARNLGLKETTKVEKMDTSEAFGAKLKHVSPTAVKKTFDGKNDKSHKPDEVKHKSPLFGKKLLLSNDKSHAKNKVTTPDSPPPPLPTSQPPTAQATKYTPHTDSAQPIPSSMPPSFSYKSSHTTVNLSTTTTTSSTKPTSKVGILKTTTTTNAPKSTMTNVSKGTTSTAVNVTTSSSVAPLKPPRIYVADSRSESPMDVDEALQKASHPRPGSEPVAVLVSPTEKNPVQEKRVLGGLLASLANVRQSKTDDVTSPTDKSSHNMPPVSKSTTETTSNRPKSESALPKSKVELSVARTTGVADVSKKEETTRDRKSKSPFSFVSDKIGIFKKDEKESDSIISKGEQTPKVTDSSSSKISAISSNVNLTSGAEKFKSNDTSKSKQEENVPSWKKVTGLKDQKSNKNNLLLDSNVSSKNSESNQSWKTTDHSKTRGSDLLQESKSEQKSKLEASDQVPAWKQRLQEKGQRKPDQLLDSNTTHKSEPVADDDTPQWMKALEKRKAEKARPKSADILLEESASKKQGKSNQVELRVKPKDEQGSPGVKERAKSASLLDDSTEKPSWQLEAQRRLAHNKQAFIDPEKSKAMHSDSADSKLVQTAPQKKPRTSNLIGDTPVRPPRLKISPKAVSPPPSPKAPVRQLKKISIGSGFEFDSTEKNKKEPPSPVKTPPQRPPAPRGTPSKMVSPGRMSPVVIQRQLDDIDKKLNNLEMRGRDLEDSIRNVDTTEEEDDMMIEWFKLINSKNELVRKEADLIYISKQQDLEDQQEDIDEMLNFLVAIPESEKTESQKKREADLIEKKLDIVNRRSSIIDCIDEDRIRYEEEDKDIAMMLEEKGFSKAYKGNQKKQTKSSGFTRYY
ncbi:MICAL-like protein 2 [Haliotis asinina]|uniref:MICAL-like protein 2 n=1 Tax=Haliotis asinina TaxID=109174 RepID=UPI003531EFC3